MFAALKLCRLTGATLAKEFRADLADVIADIRASGTSTLRGIANALNERGIATRRGGKWSAVQVQRVMGRED